MNELPAYIHFRRLLTVAGVLAIAVTGIACGGSEAPSAAPEAPKPAATTATRTPSVTTQAAPAKPATSSATVAVFFSSSDGQSLVKQTRPAPSDATGLRAALVALVAGPGDTGALPALPQGTTIIGTNVSGGEALVNLSEEFEVGYPSGSAAEQAVLAPIVFTATAVPGVSRVRITVAGRTPNPVGSQYDWSGAFSRDDFGGLAVTG